MVSLSLCEHQRNICGSFALQLKMTTESRVITLHTVLQSSADAYARFAALHAHRQPGLIKTWTATRGRLFGGNHVLLKSDWLLIILTLFYLPDIDRSEENGIQSDATKVWNTL